VKVRTDQERWEGKLEAARRRKSLRDQAIEYKGGKCNICGYNRCASAFDFHHLDPQEKDFTISAHMTSWDRIKKEIDKCVLLCANCHREVHDGMHPGYLALDGPGRGQYDEPDPEPLDDEEECDAT
jgi:hypothetical protein